MSEENNSNTKVEPSVIVKTFSAPRALVFDAWTQVEHLNQWMFPMEGCQCEFVEADIKTGGSSLHKITMPNGHEMWLFTRYELVESPNKLVFLQYLSNKDSEIVPNPQMPDWPKDMVATLLFEELADGNTQITFEWEPRNPSASEIAAFEASRADHGRGWGAGMEQLSRYLENLNN